MPAPISFWAKLAGLRLRAASFAAEERPSDRGNGAPSNIAGHESALARWGEDVAAALGPPERRARRSTIVLRLTAPFLAAVSAIAIPAAANTPTLSTGSWWEKVTVTMSGDGKTQSCKYEASAAGTSAKDCDVDDHDAGPIKASGTKDLLTKITFERRFSPGAVPALGSVQAGDTLLGGQVMALAIDGVGKVSGCKVVATSGDMTPDYGCAEASTERFEAIKASAKAAPRQGYMSILIYAHKEHVA
jgi:hypothetical protein